MTPSILKTGVKNVSISFTNIDNQLSVYINPDGPQGNGSMGWSTVLEVNASGMSYNEGGYTIDLDPFLSNYKNNGATSVTLVVVGSNWASGGVFTGVIQWPASKSQAISFAPDPFSSQQVAYTLEF